MDEISAAFAQLTPDQLIRDTSAIRQQTFPIEHVRANLTCGPTAWDKWVDDALHALSTASRVSTVQSFTLLHTINSERCFVPDPDETAPMYAERLQREAWSMGAIWMFNAMIAPGAYHDTNTPPEPVDADDVSALRAALESGRLHMSVCWFAEMREGPEQLIRSGVIPITPDGTLLDPIEGDLDPEQNLFRSVLRAK